VGAAGWVLVLALAQLQLPGLEGLGELPGLPGERDLAEGLAGSVGAERVRAALRDNPALLQGHRGYLAYLQAHPDVALAEEAFAALLGDDTFRRAWDRFDEALLANADAARAYDAFLQAQARDGDLLAAAQALDRLQARIGADDPDAAAGIDYLRANPETARVFLDPRRRLRPTPRELYALRVYLRGNEEVAGRLREVVDVLAAQSAATAAYRWWGYTEGDGPVAESYETVKGYLMGRPAAMKAWRARELMLARRPNDRRWLQWWHRRLRRAPAVADMYYDYLVARAADPEAVEGLGALDDTGTADAWPLDAAPPALAPLDQWRGVRPERPDIRGPDLPDIDVERPAMPDVPRIPAGAQRPRMPEPGRPATRGGEPAGPSGPAAPSAPRGPGER
jgi:hypothetical protein